MNALPAVLLMCGFLVVGWLIVGRSAFYQALCAPRTGARFASLDGLRGFLALGVFLHHGIIWHGIIASQPRPPLGPYCKYLGQGSVIFFFLITGFLFWTKVVKAGGRIDPIDLYRNR